MTKRVTIITVLIAAVVLIGWDIYAYVSKEHVTISWLALQMGIRYPFIPLVIVFAGGVLVGHFGWSQTRGK
ncbi:MAG: hypothetical protein IH969_08740 [Candidatus Krumholzibacteriota bacterium]|nr:hypothetical protein [Candidatus Krumholzibacteriota bacterium]